MKSVKFVEDKIFRLRLSVALVYRNGIMEFFKTNVRESVNIKTEHNLIEFLQNFDGKNSVKEILKITNFDKESVINLINFLNKKFILIEINEKYDEDLLQENYRIINFLEDYFSKTSDVIRTIENLSDKKVIIFGLGGVGSWVADTLARSGVKNFILVDDDIVDETNLHRQDFYTQSMVGMAKIDCIQKNLEKISNINVEKIYEKLDEDFFLRHNLKFDLAINCADYPNVDTTTKIIGKECMKRKIKHIVGGGYNLHLTLIGQAIIPFETACYKCFDTALSNINLPPLQGVKKLYRQNRKIGSFTPLCTISASIASLEAFKILCGLDEFLTTTSRRIEFALKDMDFKILQIPKNENCKVCSNENHGHKNT